MKKIRGQPAAGIMGGKEGKQGRAGGDFQRGSGPKAEKGFPFSVMLLSFPASESVRTEHLRIEHLLAIVFMGIRKEVLWLLGTE